jgi:hypothetical protein
MAESYLIQVDLEQLRRHHSIFQRRPMSESEIRLWLVQEGFYPRVDGLYLAEEALLRRLDASEILDLRPVLDIPPA